MVERAQIIPLVDSSVRQICTYNVANWDRRPTSGAKIPERLILNNCLWGSKVSTIRIKCYMLCGEK